MIATNPISMAGGRLTDHPPQPAWILGFQICNYKNTPRYTPLELSDARPTGRPPQSTDPRHQNIFSTSSKTNTKPRRNQRSTIAPHSKAQAWL